MFTYSSRENLSASMEVESLNPNSGLEFPESGEEAWIGNCSWAFALCSISNQREWVALGTGHQQRLSHVQKELKKIASIQKSNLVDTAFALFNLPCWRVIEVLFL